MLLSDAQAVVQSNGGFDPQVAGSDQATQFGWISAAVSEAVAEAEHLKQRRDFGPTTIGGQDYLIDEDVIEIKSLRVGATRRWLRVTLEDLEDAQYDPSAYLVGTPGCYAPQYGSESAQDASDADQMTAIRIWPAPSAAGLAVNAICAVQHPDLTAGGQRIQVPADLVRALAVDGGIARGMVEAHERADLAAPYLARYTDAKASLKARGNKRVGGGVRYARIRGR